MKKCNIYSRYNLTVVKNYFWKLKKKALLCKKCVFDWPCNMKSSIAVGQNHISAVSPSLLSSNTSLFGGFILCSS